MSRQITLDHTTLRNLEISIRPNGSYSVSIRYTINDDSDNVIQSKTIERHSSTSRGSPKLPASWETTFDAVIQRVSNALDTLENL